MAKYHRTTFEFTACGVHRLTRESISELVALIPGTLDFNALEKVRQSAKAAMIERGCRDLLYVEMTVREFDKQGRKISQTTELIFE